VNSPTKPPPDLSVILITPDCYKTISRTISSLMAQTVCERLELVLLAPSRKELDLPDEAIAAFHSIQVIESSDLRTLSAPRALGIRASRASLVAVAEDHAFPEPGWAEALIEAHRQPWAAVGPVFLNCNPGLMSWVSLIMDYGRWIEPAAGGVTDDVPGHNSSWKRSVLVEYGDALERMLQAPTLLHWDLNAKGHRLYLEPAAKVSHANITRLRSFLLDHYYGGQLFAAVRAREWPFVRRLFYAAAFPIFTVRKLREWLAHIRRVRLEQTLLPKAWPLLVISAITHTLGESAGYCLGVGMAERKVFNYDARRGPHFSARERKLLVPY
jgi:hypothetical protein